MDRRLDPRVSVLRGVALPERYQPLRRIASGGMASVWCAHDRTLDRDVAIKLLAEPYAHDEVAGRRFKREARAAARLSGHSNVVTIYDVGQTAPSRDDPFGRPFIVMEYLAGGTVADALRARRGGRDTTARRRRLDRDSTARWRAVDRDTAARAAVDRDTAVRWLWQAAAALDYAHRRGVIHRDVKLANFLLDRDRVLHVADFGIAQLGTEDTLTSQGQVLGTAGYLAPERALGHPATEASDRYALAVAAFELLVGERPFTAEHFTALARQHVDDPPPAASRRNPALPAALDPVLARAMAKRPRERFATASDFAAAVERALADGGASRGRAGALAGAGASRGRTATLAGGGASRGRTAALAALAAGALGVGIATGVNSGSGSPASSIRSHRSSHAAQLNLRAAVPSIPPLATPTTPTTTAATTPSKPPPAPPAGAPDALEAQGHQLMDGGNYTQAIPVLQHAVAQAAPSSLTYAYALYDLGRSLRLAGDPRAAVPILYRRLQIPNQTDTVRSELTLALRALGQQASGNAGQQSGGDAGQQASGGTTVSPGQDGHNHGRGHQHGAAGPPGHQSGAASPPAAHDGASGPPAATQGD
jgi:serine/threonine-protein kinase